MDEWIAVFKSGTHTDAAGKQHIISNYDLDVIANKYNEQSDHEAPAVIGHPKSNGPAWGWVDKLKHDSGVLYAKFKDLQSEFVELLERKMFKKRSISLYPDMTLRHVGFLGAMPPAVKGLPDFAFEETDNALEFEFVEKQSFKEKVIDLFSNFIESVVDREETVNEQPENNQEPDEQTPAEDTEKQETVNMSEELQKQLDELTQKVADFQEQVKTLTTERDQAKADLAAVKNAEIEKAKADFMEANKNFVDGLDLMPKYKSGLESVLNSLNGAAVIEFGEAGELSPAVVLQNIVTDILKAEDFSEVLVKKDATVQIDNPAAKLEAETRKIMDRDSVDYVEAFGRALREFPDLATEYKQTYGN